MRRPLLVPITVASLCLVAVTGTAVAFGQTAEFSGTVVSGVAPIGEPSPRPTHIPTKPHSTEPSSEPVAVAPEQPMRLGPPDVNLATGTRDGHEGDSGRGGSGSGPSRGSGSGSGGGSDSSSGHSGDSGDSGSSDGSGGDSEESGSGSGSSSGDSDGN